MKNNMTADLLNRIEINPEKCGGKPCIIKTRIRVSDILDLLADGVSFDEILDDFPVLEADDIKASIKYAANSVNHVTLYAA